VVTTPPYEEECFFIAPIGGDGSPVRARSDRVRDHIVKPAVDELGLRAVRADDLSTPGQITLQVVEHVLGARAAVADLTGRNPNVYYELALRHAVRLPVVLIADHEEIDRLPFDIQQMRVIAVDHTDLESAARAKQQIVLQLGAALRGAIDSPIATALAQLPIQKDPGVRHFVQPGLHAADEDYDGMRRLEDRLDELGMAWTILNRRGDTDAIDVMISHPDGTMVDRFIFPITTRLTSTFIERLVSVTESRIREWVKKDSAKANRQGLADDLPPPRSPADRLNSDPKPRSSKDA